MIKHCDRSEAGSREIIFKAGVVIGRFEVRQERVTAARADLAVYDVRVATGIRRTPDANRGVEIEELRARPRLGCGQPQLKLRSEPDPGIQIRKPIGILSRFIDRHKFEDTRSGFCPSCAAYVAIHLDAANADLSVDTHLATEWELVIQLRIGRETFLIGLEARGRIVGRPIATRESREDPELFDIVPDARIGRG